MNFGEAVEICKTGRRVRNKKWNGRNMSVYYVRPSTVKAENWREWETDMEIKVHGHFDMVCADGSILVGWLASQMDMESDVWEEL